tara:strand:- start:7617 stop:7808 length:192 start_codon:yes stop_codon:yes gene_type:complete
MCAILVCDDRDLDRVRSQEGEAKQCENSTGYKVKHAFHSGVMLGFSQPATPPGRNPKGFLVTC